VGTCARTIGGDDSTAKHEKNPAIRSKSSTSSLNKHTMTNNRHSSRAPTTSPTTMMQQHQLTTFCFNPELKAYEARVTERSLGVHDVLIKTTHSGICYTDVHAKLKGCGLGHEGVGVVQQVGEAVSHIQVGDRVGWGWLHSVSIPRA
jgi:hypothetical protein